MSEPVNEPEIPVESVPLEVDDVAPSAPAVEAPPVAAEVERRPVEAWQAAYQVTPWKHKGTCYAQGWALGREVTEVEYLEAVMAFGAHQIGRE